MNSFLIPANSKKGTLIFSMFRPVDLIVFGTGIGISLLLLIIFPNTTDTLGIIMICTPALITGALVFPIPNYHNTMVAIQSMLNCFLGRRRFIWKGWCFYEQFIEEDAREKQKK